MLHRRTIFAARIKSVCTTDMTHSEVTYENDQFRATKWTIPPGDHIPMHTHEYDYVVVPLCNTVMHVRTDSGELLEAQMQIGTSYGRPAGSAHECLNRGQDEIVFIEVEYIGGASNCQNAKMPV